MPAAPRSCLHAYGGQDGGRDLYRGLQHHPAGLERDYEQEFIVGHGHAQIGQLCAIGFAVRMTNPVRHAPADRGASAMAAWKTLPAADQYIQRVV